MQKIDIDGIIDELKKTEEWGRYEKFLGNKFFYEKETINKLLKEWKSNFSDEFNFPEWKDREEKFPVFKKLEILFVEIFVNKYQFCPYCGKHSLIIYKNDEGENKRFFDLDHIFPKNSYKYLTYNFYNLLPSCKLCNQAKSTKNFINSAKVGKSFYHPYFGYIEKQDGRKNKIEKFQIQDKFYDFNLLNSNSKFLKLDKIYLNSQDTKNDIWFIRDKIEKIKTEKINIERLKLNKNLKEGEEAKKLEGDNLENFLEERKDLFFKNFYPKSEQEILKFANGKLKKDLIENLDSIKFK